MNPATVVSRMALVLSVSCAPRSGLPDASSPTVVRPTDDPLRDVLPSGLTVQFAFRRSEQSLAVVFATTPEPIEHRAVLLARTAEAWREVPIHADEANHATWVHAAASRGGASLWGIADTNVEAPGWSLLIVRSVDGGRTWHEATLEKPYYMAELESLHVDESGEGAIVVHLDDDYGTSLTPGRYTSRTRDGGATWSTWTRSGNVHR